jgi:hypothetical protein
VTWNLSEFDFWSTVAALHHAWHSCHMQQASCDKSASIV